MIDIGPFLVDVKVSGNELWWMDEPNDPPIRHFFLFNISVMKRYGLTAMQITVLWVAIAIAFVGWRKPTRPPAP